MTAVSLQCKIKNHHPEWSNVSHTPPHIFVVLYCIVCTYMGPGQKIYTEIIQVYNTTFIRWTTHSPPGLSARDADLAAICDELAQSFGEVQEEEASSGGQSCQLKGLADQAASASGDCCTPKSASK